MASVVVALAHFCETHGPREVFATRRHDVNHVHGYVIHEDAPHVAKQVSRELPAPDQDAAAATGVSEATKLADVMPPKPALTTETTSNSRPCCESDGLRYSSISQADRACFISTPAPDPDVFAAVRAASLRSLCVEFTPGREGPILFGDDAAGTVFSYAFKLSDPRARGSQRWYSFVVLAADASFLVHSWNHLFRELRSTVSELQERSRVSQLRNNTAAGRGLACGSAASIAYRRSGRGYTLTGLHDLLDMPRLYLGLHRRIAWVIESCRWRLTQHGMPLPSLPSPAPELAVVLAPLRELARESSPGFLTPVLSVLFAGGQVVVQADDRERVRVILRAMAHLLPSSARREVYWCMSYVPTSIANLLGLPLDQPIAASAGLRAVLVIEPSGTVRLGEHVVGLSASLARALDRALVHESISDDMLLALASSLLQQWRRKAEVIHNTSINAPIQHVDRLVLLRSLDAEQSADVAVLRFLLRLDHRRSTASANTTSAASTPT